MSRIPDPHKNTQDEPAKSNGLAPIADELDALMIVFAVRAAEHHVMVMATAAGAVQAA